MILDHCDSSITLPFKIILTLLLISSAIEYSFKIQLAKISSLVAQIQALIKSISFLSTKLNNEDFKYETDQLTNSFNDFIADQ